MGKAGSWALTFPFHQQKVKTCLKMRFLGLYFCFCLHSKTQLSITGDVGSTLDSRGWEGEGDRAVSRDEGRKRPGRGETKGHLAELALLTAGLGLQRSTAATLLGSFSIWSCIKENSEGVFLL